MNVHRARSDPCGDAHPGHELLRVHRMNWFDVFHDLIIARPVDSSRLFFAAPLTFG